MQICVSNHDDSALCASILWCWPVLTELACLSWTAPSSLPFMQIFLAPTHTRTHTCTDLCCSVGFSHAVSLDSYLKQTGRVHGVPSWHVPWDNERLYYGFHCWLRIILLDKQATVQSCGNMWCIFHSQRQGQIWSVQRELGSIHNCGLYFIFTDYKCLLKMQVYSSQTMQYCCCVMDNSLCHFSGLLANH